LSSLRYGPWLFQSVQSISPHAVMRLFVRTAFMNIEQIRAAAETQVSYLCDPACLKICVASSAADPVAARIVNLLQSTTEKENLGARVFRAGSFGCYDLEPIVTVERPGRFAVLYNNATPEKVADYIHKADSAALEIIKPFGCIGSEKFGKGPHISELPLASLQSRIALRNCGWIDPDDINHYICRGRGYAGLSNAFRLTPREITESLIPSVLRGRGWPGCSTREKWKLAGSEKAGGYLICNAVDPDPESLTGRLLMESDPHSVLEGMLIGAYAAGASRCILLVEGKTGAVKRLGNALEQMRAYNLLGSNILDSKFGAEIKIEEMPAALASGRWIELLRCLEEKRSFPHMLPAHPAALEITGHPVIIVNPESMSCLSASLCMGMKYRTGSKVVTLSGSVNHKNVAEVPLGTTIQRVIDLLGGGVSNGKSIKAVQIGGPNGLLITPESLDLPIGCSEDEESVSNIGSGSIRVLDADSPIVDRMKEAVTYLQVQSCGKCVFCREGCLQILSILEDLSENKNEPDDLELLVALCEEMKTGCLCAFGRAVPNPVITGLRIFRAEWEK